MNVYLPKKMATAYEAQFGGWSLRWVHLRGGHWRCWWQLDRWSLKYRREEKL